MQANEPVAILSDVHGNLVALRSVLDDITMQGIGRIVVAGDMIGFGPQPDGVVDLLIERGAEMIRGNNEQDYVAVYETAAMPSGWRTSLRWANLRWTMERLGSQRRKLLSALPDAIRLDDNTLVVHGSPRSALDAVCTDTLDEELEAMFAGDPARLAFMGHTHRPLVRDLPSRRLVNVGSVGMPLDGDPRAGYVIWNPLSNGLDAPGEVTIRRVPYDLDAAVAAFDNGLAEADPYLAPILILQIQTAQSYLGPWLRYSRDIPDEELTEALGRFLTRNSEPKDAVPKSDV